ncbi:hypothetical protein ABT187_38070 [Streptomyces sp. NPDC001817]|uniref:hypothetical protein n=1 Tax=Streptomyces sp. NPDC001817 TaxID=3154398 RepID=UPI0033337706
MNTIARAAAGAAGTPGDPGAGIDRGERGLDQIRGPQVDPVLGREVPERQRLFVAEPYVVAEVVV